MGKVRYKETSTEYINSIDNSLSRKSLGFENNIKEYYFIKIEDLEPFEYQARKIFNSEDLECLADSISEVGITSPLLVVPSHVSGKYQVINGERRLRAAKLSGLKDLPCIITHDSNKSKIIALVDNIQRADLHPLELAEAYKEILDKKEEKDQIALSKKLGVSESKISETMMLNSLPEEIKSFILNNDIKSRAVLRRIKKCKNSEEMFKILIPQKAQKSSFKQKNIFNVFYQNGEIKMNIKKEMLDDQKKSELKKFLEEIIRGL